MGVSSTAVASVVGIDTAFKNLKSTGITLLPQRVAIVGQGSSASSYATTKLTVTSATQVGATYGFGSPVHLAALQLLPINGDGIGSIPLTIYPLEDDGSGVASAGDITPSGAQLEGASYIIRINNIDSAPFVIAESATVAQITALMETAINANLNMPMIATDGTTVLDLESKWKGTSANDFVIEVIGSTTAGTVFAITQPVGGLVNPDVDDALDQMGDVWETMVVNCMDVADTATLAKYTTFGEGRWGELTKKPLVVFSGNTNTTVILATAVSDARKTDRVNAQLVAPGSTDLPFVTAARQLARIVVIAQENPARDYGSQKATGLTPGADGDQWNYADRDSAIKLGSSSITVRDSVVTIADVVTFYHPTGDLTPAYRYVCDIVKLQTIIFNLDLIFNNPEWDGAPLIPDDQPTANPTAKKPKTAIAAVASMLDALGLEAIISDTAEAKKNITAVINDQNPKRLDVTLTVQLSGNTNIISVDLFFGFFFGGA